MKILNLNQVYKLLFYILIAISLVGCKACESDCPDLNKEQTKWALFQKEDNNKVFKFIDKYGDTSKLDATFYDDYIKGGLMIQCSHGHFYTLKGTLQNNNDLSCKGIIELKHVISKNDESMSLCDRINQESYFKDAQSYEYKKLSFFSNDSNYVVLKKNEGIVKINFVSNNYTRIQ